MSEEGYDLKSVWVLIILTVIILMCQVNVLQCSAIIQIMLALLHLKLKGPVTENVELTSMQCR